MPFTHHASRITHCVLLIALLAACQPAPEPTPERPRPTAELPAATLTPVPTSNPVGTREPMAIEPEPAHVWGTQYGYIFPILWNTSPPRPPSKHGLAWHTTVCTDAAELGVSWYFDWGTRRNSCPQQPPAFYPTWRPHRVYEWNQQVSPDYDGIALFLNEPDWLPQDNLTPAAAAHLYRQFQTAVCPRCKAIVLNLSYGNTSYLTEWREAYRAAYGEYPAVFAYGLHVYGSKSKIISHIEAYRAALVAIGEGDKKIWLTEFGGCWQGEQPFAHQLTPAAMGEVLAYLEAQPYIAGYAFFGVRWYKPGGAPPEGLHCDSLFGDEGITPLGEQYANPPGGYP